MSENVAENSKTVERTSIMIITPHRIKDRYK